MKTVFKYTIPKNDYFILELPQGAEILSVQVQHAEPQLWALVDPDAKREVRKFRFAGTGHPIDDRKDQTLVYIDTFQMHGGGLVFHIFEVEERPF